MTDHGVSIPWQVKLCLDNRFPFLPIGDGFMFSAEFFAHITGSQPDTVTKWMNQSNCRKKTFGRVMMTEADFFSMRQWEDDSENEEQR